MRTFTLSSLCLLLFTSCQTPEGGTSIIGKDVLSADEIHLAKRNPDFEKHVKPILQTKCVMCHTMEAQPNKMSLANRAEAQRSGAIGGMIVPGKPEQSSLLMRLDESPTHLKAMPPVGERLTKNEVQILRRWIKNGANWPKGDAGTVQF